MHTNHSEKSRELAVELLRQAPGVVPCMTIAEGEWVREGGSFVDVHRACYGKDPYYEHEPQQRFLDVVAEGLETLTALSPYDPEQSVQRRAEHAARYELNKRTLDELACILFGWPDDGTRRSYDPQRLPVAAKALRSALWALRVLDRWTRAVKGRGHETRSTENPNVPAACELFEPGEASACYRAEDEEQARMTVAARLVGMDPSLAEGLAL